MPMVRPFTSEGRMFTGIVEHVGTVVAVSPAWQSGAADH